MFFLAFDFRESDKFHYMWIGRLVFIITLKKNSALLYQCYGIEFPDRYIKLNGETPTRGSRRCLETVVTLEVEIRTQSHISGVRLVVRR